MSKKFDFIAIGRAAIDLNAVEYNRPMEETHTFSKYVGGSPANIAIGAAKLGMKVGFIGKLSEDQHGHYIKSYLEDSNVDTGGVVFDKDGHKSGLAFTEIKSPEECSILMYRDEVADLFLTPEEVSEEYLKNTEALVVSGTALAQSPSREAILKAVALAKDNDIKIIFELDYRPYTWKNPEEVAVYYSLVARESSVVIGTRDEFDMMENLKDGNDHASADYLFNYEPELVIIKHGVKGSYAFEKNGKTHRGYAYKSDVLKTFGAGDSYAAAFITALSHGKPVDEALKYGSASAAIVVSKHSSSDAMPNLEEIEALIEKQSESYGK